MVALPRPLISQNTIAWAARDSTWAYDEASFDDPIPVLINTFLVPEHTIKISITHFRLSVSVSCVSQVLLSIASSPFGQVSRHRLVASRAQSRVMDGPSSVIVPLYVYPSAGAWDPFHDVYDTVPLLLLLLVIAGLTICTTSRASSFPRIHFTVVINVHNGPGEGALPNAEYTAAIEALNSLSNVRTIGYVATTWCTRDLSSVLDDIAAFSFWGEYDPSLALSGVFVDETPTQYSTDYAVYLDSITQAVQDSAGLKDSFIGKLSPPFYVLIEDRYGSRLSRPLLCCRSLYHALSNGSLSLAGVKKLHSSTPAVA